MAVQSPQHCLNFHHLPRIFPKDGKFGVYFKIITDGDIRQDGGNNRTVYMLYDYDELQTAKKLLTKSTSVTGGNGTF